MSKNGQKMLAFGPAFSILRTNVRKRNSNRRDKDAGSRQLPSDEPSSVRSGLGRFGSSGWIERARNHWLGGDERRTAAA